VLRIQKTLGSFLPPYEVRGGGVVTGDVMLYWLGNWHSQLPTRQLTSHRVSV